MSIDKLNKNNFVPTHLPTKVPAEKVNEIIDVLNALVVSTGTAFPTTVTAAGATDALIIDATTTDHTGDALIDIDVDVAILAAQLLTAVNVNADVNVAMGATDVVNGFKATIDGLAADTNGSMIAAFNADITSPTTSRADTAGLYIGIDSVRSTDDTDNGVVVGFAGTMNSSGAGTYGLRVTSASMTHTDGTFWGSLVTMTNTITAGAAYGHQVLADSTNVNNPKYGIFISKDIVHSSGAGNLTNTNYALYIDQSSVTNGTATGKNTVANTCVYIRTDNSTVRAVADVYSGVIMTLDYYATTATAGTATNSATGFLLQYTLTETAGTLSNTAFNVAYIDFDTTGTPDFANGTYNLLYINGTTASSLNASATATLNGTKIDLSAVLVDVANLTLYGLNIVMPATYGTSTEVGVLVAGDGTTVSLCLDGAIAVAVGGTVTTGISIGGTTTTGLSINKTVVTPILIGVKHTDTAGSGLPIPSTDDWGGIRVFTDDAGISISDSVRCIQSRTLLTVAQAAGTVRGIQGQFKIVGTTNFDTGVYTPVQGYIEVAGTTHTVAAAGILTCFDASIECGDGSTVTPTGYLSGYRAELTGGSGTLNAGLSSAFLATNASTQVWAYGMYLEASAITTGIYIGACTTGINLTGTITTHLYSSTTMVVDMPVSSVGTGFDTALGVKQIPYGKRGVAGMIVTEIYVDLHAAAVTSKNTDLDVIGEAAGGGQAWIARITAANHGTIVGMTMTCIELPATGDVDINVCSSTAATGVYDDGGAGLAGYVLLLDAGGNWTLSLTKSIVTYPAADAYLYLLSGNGGVAGAYNAGKFIITLYGV